jgi:hypothetical protein
VHIAAGGVDLRVVGRQLRQQRGVVGFMSVKDNKVIILAAGALEV